MQERTCDNCIFYDGLTCDASGLRKDPEEEACDTWAPILPRRTPREEDL